MSPLHFENLFDQFFQPFATKGRRTKTHVPRESQRQDEQAYELSLELPGVPPGALDIEVLDGLLHLKVDAQESAIPEGYLLVRHERAPVGVQRRWRLPKDVDVDAVEARLVDGRLTLRLPKLANKGARKIELAA